jgi:hypothetical protein
LKRGDIPKLLRILKKIAYSTLKNRIIAASAEGSLGGFGQKCCAGAIACLGLSSKTAALDVRSNSIAAQLRSLCLRRDLSLGR